MQEHFKELIAKRSSPSLLRCKQAKVLRFRSIHLSTNMGVQPEKAHRKSFWEPFMKGGATLTCVLATVPVFNKRPPNLEQQISVHSCLSFTLTSLVRY